MESKATTLKKTSFINIRQPGLGGLVTKFDPTDIQDTQSPDLRNITFDGGIPGPRFGTSLFLAAPTGETGVPSQLLKATDSNGKAYVIGVYGTNFYLLDWGYAGTPQWILLNSGYSPTKSGLYYGSADWNNGLGSDAFYFCNGIDSVMKWKQSLGYLSVAATAGDSTLTLADSSTFPTSGTVIIMDNTGAPFTATISGNSANVITLSAPVGKVLAIGNALTMVMEQMAGMPIGKIIRAAVAGTAPKLLIANGKGTESTINYSQDGLPETFGVTTDTKSGGVRAIPNGEGGILDLINFGSFFVVIKQNSFSRFYFTIDTTNVALLEQVDPLEFGASVLPIGMRASLVVENNYVYPTKSQGIYQFVPSATGGQTSTQNNPFSDDIFPTLQKQVDFSIGATVFYRRQLFFACSTIPNVNNIVLVRDMVYNAWTVWDNFNSVDMVEANDMLYFMTVDDGGIYFYDETSYQDFRKAQPIGYDAYLTTKSFDFGIPANPKTSSLIMVRGFIPSNTKLKVVVLANEEGSLSSPTYTIDGDNTVYVKQVPIYGPGRRNIGQKAIGGAQTGTIGVFRCYLDFPKGVGYHNIQLRFESTEIGDNWGITTISFNADENTKVPSELVISTD